MVLVTTVTTNVKHRTKHLTLLFHTLCLVVLVSNANGSNCRAPRAIQDATYDYSGLRLPNGRYNDGAVITYTCNEGFTKSKDSNGTLTCLDGKWTGDANKLRCCKIQICTDPNLFCVLPQVDGASPDIVVGNASFPIDNGEKMAYGVGTGVKFICHDDRVLADNSIIGPFECLHGGQWSPNSITICQKKTCGPPPTIANGRIQDSWQEGYDVGMQYKYVCDSGYELFLDTIRCDSDLTWKTTLGVGTHSLSLDFPQCSKKITSSYSDTNYYDSTKKKGEERTTLKFVVIFATVAFVAVIIGIIAFRGWLRCHKENSRARAIIVNGVATTEYAPPTNYTGPPPTLTTGPVIFAPPQGSPYPMHGGGGDPLEACPLTSQSEKNDSHFNGPSPPTYSDTDYESNKNPSAPPFSSS